MCNQAVGIAVNVVSRSGNHHYQTFCADFERVIAYTQVFCASADSSQASSRPTSSNSRRAPPVG